jgi:hypothetical protein
MSYDRLPDRITGPMTTSQANTPPEPRHRGLSGEAFPARPLSRRGREKDRPSETGDRIGQLFLTDRFRLPPSTAGSDLALRRPYFLNLSLTGASNL